MTLTFFVNASSIYQSGTQKLPLLHNKKTNTYVLTYMQKLDKNRYITLNKISTTPLIAETSTLKHLLRYGVTVRYLKKVESICNSPTRSRMPN